MERVSGLVCRRVDIWRLRDSRWSIAEVRWGSGFLVRLGAVFWGKEVITGNASRGCLNQLISTLWVC